MNLVIWIHRVLFYITCLTLLLTCSRDERKPPNVAIRIGQEINGPTQAGGLMIYASNNQGDKVSFAFPNGEPAEGLFLPSGFVWDFEVIGWSGDQGRLTGVISCGTATDILIEGELVDVEINISNANCGNAQYAPGDYYLGGGEVKFKPPAIVSCRTFFHLDATNDIPLDSCADDEAILGESASFKIRMLSSSADFGYGGPYVESACFDYVDDTDPTVLDPDIGYGEAFNVNLPVSKLHVAVLLFSDSGCAGDAREVHFPNGFLNGTNNSLDSIIKAGTGTELNTKVILADNISGSGYSAFQSLLFNIECDNGNSCVPYYENPNPSGTYNHMDECPENISGMECISIYSGSSNGDQIELNLNGGTVTGSSTCTIDGGNTNRLDFVSCSCDSNDNSCRIEIEPNCGGGPDDCTSFNGDGSESFFKIGYSIDFDGNATQDYYDSQNIHVKHMAGRNIKTIQEGMFQLIGYPKGYEDPYNSGGDLYSIVSDISLYLGPDTFGGVLYKEGVNGCPAGPIDRTFTVREDGEDLDIRFVYGDSTREIPRFIYNATNVNPAPTADTFDKQLEVFFEGNGSPDLTIHFSCTRKIGMYLANSTDPEHGNSKSAAIWNAEDPTTTRIESYDHYEDTNTPTRESAKWTRFLKTSADTYRFWHVIAGNEEYDITNTYGPCGFTKYEPRGATDCKFGNKVNMSAYVDPSGDVIVKNVGANYMSGTEYFMMSEGIAKELYNGSAVESVDVSHGDSDSNGKDDGTIFIATPSGVLASATNSIYTYNALGTSGSATKVIHNGQTTANQPSVYAIAGNAKLYTQAGGWETIATPSPAAPFAATSITYDVQNSKLYLTDGSEAYEYDESSYSAVATVQLAQKAGKGTLVRDVLYPNYSGDLYIGYAVQTSNDAEIATTNDGGSSFNTWHTHSSSNDDISKMFWGPMGLMYTVTTSNGLYKQGGTTVDSALNGIVINDVTGYSGTAYIATNGSHLQFCDIDGAGVCSATPSSNTNFNANINDVMIDQEGMLLIAHDSGLHMVRPPLSGGINTSQIGSHSDFLREADPANSYAPFCMNVTDNSAGGGLCGSVPAVVEVSGDTLNASGAAVFTCTTYPGPFLIDYVDPVTCNGNEADYYGAYSIDYLFKIEADDSDTISCNNVGNATARPDSTKSCLENALDLFL